MTVKDLPTKRIRVAKNVRIEEDDELQELVNSIRERGLLQPILVRHTRTTDYEVVAGHRRLAAVKLLGEQTIACIIDDEITEADRTIIQLTENCQRKQMLPYEYVEVFEQLRRADPSLTRAKIGQLIGRSRSWVQHQYDAVSIAGILVGDGADPREVKALTTGQIVGRAQARGLTTKGRRAVTDFVSVSCINSTTINVRCESAAVTARVLEAIDQLRIQLRKELEKLDGIEEQKQGRKRA